MRFRLLPWTAALVCVACVWAGAQQKPAAEEKKKKEYVGSETCAGCHDELVGHFNKKNPHAALETNKSRGWATRACESCHGPGSVHAESTAAEDIQNPAKMGAGAVNRLCLSCHKNQPTQVGRIGGGHVGYGVACTSCHDMHKTGAESSAERYRKPAGINKQCASCHLEIWAAFQKPHHHKVPEGAMACTSCHNPHASLGQGRNMRLTSAQEPGCFKCHADKRGPFVFEHAPVKSEPCSICHEPHGSVNPRMLTRSNMTSQCLECHSNIQAASSTGVAGGIPPAIHDLRTARWRNCTVCHQKIHGSNVNGAMLR